MNDYIPKIIGFFINTIAVFSSKYAAHLSIQLFSFPQKGKTKPIEAEYFNQTKQEDVIYNDLVIKTYHWPGSKETVLLVHGWESNSYRWKDFINVLQKLDYNIIAIDAPAHGNSSGKTFNALIYSECITKVSKQFNVSIIIGHSVGGMATVFSQYNTPNNLIKKLVLLGAPSNFTGLISRYITMMGYSTKVSNAITQYILENFHHLPEYFSPSNFSKSLKVKGLVIHDTDDKIIPYQDGLDLKKHYKNSQFISTTGFGHSLKSDEVYNHILEFLEA